MISKYWGRYFPVVIAYWVILVRVRWGVGWGCSWRRVALIGFANGLRGLELQSASNEYKGVSEGFPNQIPQAPEIFPIIPYYSTKTSSAENPHKEFSYFTKPASKVQNFIFSKQNFTIFIIKKNHNKELKIWYFLALRNGFRSLLLWGRLIL